MTFKEKLVILRKAKGLTQDEFAAAVGVSRQAVYKWECGQSYPEVPKLLEMKMLFTITIDELIDDSIDIPIPERKKRKRIPKDTAEKIESTVKREVNVEKKPAPKAAPAPKIVYNAPAPEAAPAPKAAPAPSYAAPAPTYAAPAPTYAAPAPTYAAPAPTYEAPAPTYKAPEAAPQYVAPTTLKLEDEFPIPKVIEVPVEEKPIVIPHIAEETNYAPAQEDEDDDSNKKVGFFGRFFGKK